VTQLAAKRAKAVGQRERGESPSGTDAANRAGVGSTTSASIASIRSAAVQPIKDFQKWLDSEFGLAIAKATSTVGKGDDLKVDAAVKAATVRAISSGRLSGKQLQAAYNELGSVNSDLAGAATDAAKKASDAAKKASDLAKQQTAAAKKQAQALKDQIDSAKQLLASTRTQIQDQLNAARSAIGDVFTGPVINPTAGSLGATGPGIGTLTSDLLAQTKQAKDFTASLATISKRGGAGGVELAKELRAQGVGTAGLEATTIAGASPAQFNKLIAAFASREKEAAKEANIVKLTARAVTLQTKVLSLEGTPSAIRTDAHDRPQTIIVNLDGKQIAKVVTKHQQKTPRLSRSR
jgi:hypothetical protein